MANVELDKFIDKVVAENKGKSCSDIISSLERKKSHRYLEIHNNGTTLKVQFLERVGPDYRSQSAIIKNFNDTPEKRAFVHGLMQVLPYRLNKDLNSETDEFTKVALQHMPSAQETYRSISHVSKILN